MSHLMEEFVDPTSETTIIEQPVVADEPIIVTEPVISQSKEMPFDASLVAPALVDDDNEGGVAPYRSTGPVASGQTTSTDDEGTIIGKNKKDDQSNENKYEVTGFQVLDAETSSTINVQQFFSSLEDAFLSINGKKFLMFVKMGFKAVNITSGVPVICYNDRIMYEHVNGSWKRV